jgi:hypothetical protein
MTRKEIMEKKRPGDYQLAAEMLGMTKGNVIQTFYRPKSKRFKMVCDAFIKISENREALVKSNKNQ